MSKKSIFEQKITAELKNKSLLITGGAGSIGSALVKKNPSISRKICSDS